MAKKESLEDAMQRLEALLGKGTVIKASEKEFEVVKERTPSGSLTLDIATGGGIPKRGKATAILGRESSSKTSLLLHIIAEEQKKGGLCCFLDVENTIDLDYAKAIGVNLDLLHLIDRESLLKHLKITDREEISGEEWLDVLCTVLKSNEYEIVGFDSVAALVPLEELQKGISGGSRMASLGALMSRAYRSINSALTVSKSGFVYLNQYRMAPAQYGLPYVEPAGEAMKYLQSLKLEITKSLDKDAGGVYGIVVKGKVTKSKICNPFKTFSYYVKFGEGIQRINEVFDLAVDFDFVTKKGGWFYFNEENKIQGEDNAIQFLKDNEEFAKELEERVIAKIKENEG